ncbi:amelotin [Rhinatrema bivittatum]|uniref:amelotin n=1 Tax=Rhinatrema bivittatum TaxID=194408 RepID=UPI00112D50B0|nr:amelotin [Rhinatrema bivittatum]
MKTVILLLCLWGTSLSMPMPQAYRMLSASNSREMQIMQLYNALGNSAKQAQQQISPGFGLPPAQMVSDHTTLQLQQQPHQDLPVDPTFGNLPVISQLSLQPGFQQLFPSINLVPLTRIMALGQDMQPGNPSAGLIPITHPLTIGGMNAQSQMLPHQAILPIIVAQIGQQGMAVSSEEMEITPQIFAGVLMPPFAPGLFPIGQTGVNIDGQDAVISVGIDGDTPAGQTGANTAVLGTAASPVPDGTLIHEQEMFGVTVPAGVRKSVTEGNIIGAGNGDRFPPYTTPPTDSVTDVIFVEPTALAEMSLNEPKKVPFSELNVPLAPRNGKFINSNMSQGRKLNAPVRGDDHLPLKAIAGKFLRFHKKRQA